MPDPFARYAELCRKVLERQWFVDQMSRLEDATFAVVQDLDRGDQRLLLVVLLVMFDDDGLRRGGRINQMVLPLTGFTVLTKRRIRRFVAAEATIHIDDILLGDIEVLCN